MGKRTLPTLILFFVLILLSSCAEENQFSTLRLQLDKGTRTISPEESAMEICCYKILLTSPEGKQWGERLTTFRYDMLVSPESEYQKSLAALREAKVELLKQKNYTASLTVRGEEYASATVTLQASEEDYNKALAAYEKLGADLNASIETMIAALRQSEAQLRALEDTLFDANIKAKLSEKATEIENGINAAKDGFFAEFESAHADDLAAIENALLEKKQELKDGIKAE